MYRTPSENLRVALLDYSRERKRSLSQRKQEKARKEKEEKEKKAHGPATKPVDVQPPPPVPPKRESRSRSTSKRPSKTAKSNKVNVSDVPQPDSVDGEGIHYANEPNIDVEYFKQEIIKNYNSGATEQFLDPLPEVVVSKQTGILASTGKSGIHRPTDSLCPPSVNKDYHSKGAFSAVKDWFMQTFTYNNAKTVNELNPSTSPEGIIITALHPANSLGVINSAGSIIDSQAQLAISQTDAQTKPKCDVTASSASSTLNNADMVVDNEFEPSESSLGTSPGLENRFCSSLPRYEVPLILKDGNAVHQTRFLQKIFALLVTKALWILAWICLVCTSQPLQELYRDFHDYHFISIGIYVTMKFIFRVAPAIRKWNIFLHVVFFTLEVLITAHILGFLLTCFVSEYHTVITNILYCLIATGTFFVIVGFSVKYDIVDAIMLGSALIVTCIMWLHQILHYSSVGKGLMEYKGSIEEMLGSLGVFAVSEIYVALTMYELKSVLTGYRFAPEPRDWLFTSVFVLI